MKHLFFVFFCLPILADAQILFFELEIKDENQIAITVDSFIVRNADKVFKNDKTVKPKRDNNKSKYVFSQKNYQIDDTITLSIRDREYEPFDTIFKIQRKRSNITISLQRKLTPESITKERINKINTLKIPITIIDTILMKEIENNVRIIPPDNSGIKYQNGHLIIPNNFKEKKIKLNITHQNYISKLIEIENKIQPTLYEYLQSNKFITLTIKDESYDNETIDNVKIRAWYETIDTTFHSDSDGIAKLRISPLAEKIQLSFEKDGYEDKKDALKAGNHDVFLKGNKTIELEFRDEAGNQVDILRLKSTFDGVEKLTKIDTISFSEKLTYSPKCKQLIFIAEWEGYRIYEDTISLDTVKNTIERILRKLEIKFIFIDEIRGDTISSLALPSLRVEQRSLNKPIPNDTTQIIDNVLKIYQNTTIVRLSLEQNTSYIIAPEHKEIKLHPDSVEYPVHLIPYLDLEVYVHRPNGKILKKGKAVPTIEGYTLKTKEKKLFNFSFLANQTDVTIKIKEQGIYEVYEAICPIQFSADKNTATIHIQLQRKRWMPSLETGSVFILQLAAQSFFHHSSIQWREAKRKDNPDWERNVVNSKKLDDAGYITLATSGAVTVGTILHDMTKKKKQQIEYCSCQSN